MRRAWLVRDTFESVSSENIDLVRRTFELFNAGDFDSVADQFAPDGEVRPAPGFPEAGPFKGRDQIRRFYAGLREGWKPGARVILRELRETGDEVLVSFQWRGTGETSGIETASDWTAVVTIRDGQIVHADYSVHHDSAIDDAGLN
jgi:ketosteroid isomerase-like protein